MYTQEVEISAVPYDAMLVDELSERLRRQLGTVPHWSGRVLSTDVAPGAAFAPPDVVSVGSEPSAPAVRSARLTLVLHQRLWPHDSVTRADATALARRVQACPNSVGVVTLDDDPVPDWLASIPQCALSTAGLDGVTAFAVDAVVACGGVVRRFVARDRAHAEARLGNANADLQAHAPAQSHAHTSANGSPAAGAADARAMGSGPPFLAQPRALSALRRELDGLAAALGTHLRGQLSTPDRTVALHSLPHRLVVQLGTIGLSFSWVGGRLGTVADGRMLVIEWEGLVARRGVSALTAATPVRERVYRVEAEDRDAWRWRLDDPNGRACSTANLAAEWMAGALIAGE